MANFINPFANSTDILGDLKKTQDELQEKKKNEDSVTVGNSPDCDFISIQEAIDFVKEGCVITIKAGTYTECLHVNKSISLVGEKAGTVIISQPKDTVCTVSKEAFFANIIFKNSKENTTELESINDIPHCALVKCEASSRFDNCTFQNSYTNGLIFEKAIQVAVCNCDFHDINNYGIYALNGASLSIKYSKISETDCDCLFISDGSYAYITNSKFYDSKSGGVTCNSAGKVTIDSCEIWNTKKAGLECRGNGTELTATNCNIYDSDYAILCVSGGIVTAESCEIWNIKLHEIIRKETGSEVTTKNCHIHEYPQFLAEHQPSVAKTQPATETNSTDTNVDVLKKTRENACHEKERNDAITLYISFGCLLAGPFWGVLYSVLRGVEFIPVDILTVTVASVISSFLIFIYIKNDMSKAFEIAGYLIYIITWGILYLIVNRNPNMTFKQFFTPLQKFLVLCIFLSPHICSLMNVTANSLHQDNPKRYKGFWSFALIFNIIYILVPLCATIYFVGIK